MSETEASAMPHTQELADILAAEQPNVVPKVIEELSKNHYNIWQIADLAEAVTKGDPVDVARHIQFTSSVESIIQQDSYNIYTAATDLSQGSYWHALTSIEKISDEKKEMREKLGKIAIEQCFDPDVYCWGKVQKENRWGPFEILERIIANKDSKLKGLISVQDFDKCIDNAFVSFVKNSDDIKPFPYAWSIDNPQNWLYRGFLGLLGHAEFLDKDRVIKTLEDNQDFDPGRLVYLYNNYLFKRFEEDWKASEDERAKIFWPVLKSILQPREEYDVYEDDKKLLHEKIKYARSDYCRKKTEEELPKILEQCYEDTWQSLEFANTIIGKNKTTEILETAVRNARGEGAMEMIERAVDGDFQNNINLSMVYVMRSHCFPKADDDKYDSDKKQRYAKGLDKLERILSRKSDGKLQQQVII